MATPSLEQIVDGHLAAYCEPDAARRQAAVRELWSQAGRLVDPPLEAAGHDAIAGLADHVLQRFPGHRFTRTTAVDAHHGFARYGWQLVAPDGNIALQGLDILELAEGGRIGRVVGFFGAQPPAMHLAES